MSTAVAIDIETLEYLPAKTLLKLVELSQKVAKNMRLFQATINTLGPLFRELEQLDIDVRFVIEEGYIGVEFTGDGPRLGQVWGLLRRHGYKTHSRPKKGDTQFYSFWEREGHVRIFLNFTSSLCRRVQVGTKTVEQPIYETICGDLSALPEVEEKPKAAEAVVVFDDDIPF